MTSYNELEQTARTLQKIGLSFVPVLGSYANDYDHAKHTIVSEWKPYQKRQPDASEVNSWLRKRNLGGWAVINGEVSNLLSADLDTPESERAFRNELGDLPASYSERTPRGGLHVWYRPPTGVALGNSIHVEKFGELREKLYTVIAPTATPDGRAWTIEGGSLDTIATLSAEQYERLRTFYSQRKPKAVQTTAKTPREPKQADRATPAGGQGKAPTDPDWLAFMSEPVEALLMAIPGAYVDSQGWVVCLSPFRSEENHSHSYNPTSGYGHDHAGYGDGEGSSYKLKDRYYPTLGLDWNARLAEWFKQKRVAHGGKASASTDAPTEPPEAPTAPVLPRFWQDGLPASVQDALNEYTPPKAREIVPCVHSAIQHKLIDPDRITARAIVEIAPQLGYPSFALRTVQRMLVELDFAFSEVYAKTSVIEGAFTTNDHFGANPGGRPEKVYRWQSPSAFKARLLTWIIKREVEKLHITPAGVIVPKVTPSMLEDSGIAPDSAKENAELLNEYLQDVFAKQDHAEREAAKEALARYEEWKLRLEDPTPAPRVSGWVYRDWKDAPAEKMRAYVSERETCSLSYETWAKKLNVSESDVSTIMRRAGVRNERQTATWGEISAEKDLVKQARRASYELKGHAEKLRAVYPDGREKVHAYPYNERNQEAMQRARTFVRDCAAQGAKVELELRVASRQHIASEGQPEAQQAPTAPVQKASIQKPHKPRQKPLQRPFYGGTYNPEALRAFWLRAIERKEWPRTENDLFSTPQGELIDRDATPHELTVALIEAAKDARAGQRPSFVPQSEIESDALLLAAFSLGAEIRRDVPVWQTM